MNQVIKYGNKKVLFVYNAHAGKAKIRNHLADILDCFTKAGFELTVYPTQGAGEAVDIVKNRQAGYDIVICSGGDGTLDEVVTGMMQCYIQVPIGYIPAGSTNDFANSLQLPKNMLSAARTILHQKKYACDVGSFNNDIFIYIAAFGLFTDVSYETKQNTKNVLGHLAYILEGMKRLPIIKSFSIAVKSKELNIEGEFIYGMVTNSLSVGGFRKITGKRVQLDDGLFEVTLIRKPKNIIELNNILAALMGKDIDKDYMYCFKTSHIEIQSNESISWTLDGEFGGKHKKVTIDNNKQAIEIFVP